MSVTIDAPIRPAAPRRVHDALHPLTVSEAPRCNAGARIDERVLAQIVASVRSRAEAAQSARADAHRVVYRLD